MVDGFALNKRTIAALQHLAKKQYVDKFKAKLTITINQIDALISRQLSQIITHRYFQRLEASWLELFQLINLPFSQKRITIKILNLSWVAVSNDLNLAFDIKQSSLFNKLYSRELDTAGGHPFGVLLIDHKVNMDSSEDCQFDDLYTLQLLSELAEVCLCPVILGVSPQFFGDDNSRVLHDTAKIARILESEDYQPWQLLRKCPSSRFVHLVLPEYKLRAPYHSYPAGFVFTQESCQANTLWGNCAYLLASNIIKEFERISWFGFLRAYDDKGEFGALVSEAQGEIKASVDIFSEDDGFWSEKGFVPFSSLYLSNQKGFFSNQSVWDIPTEAEQVLGMLQTNLMACRFGHYLKVKTRDYVGSFDSVLNCKNSLESWLNGYVNRMTHAEDHIMARYPLQSCKVELEADTLDSTHYHCQITLQPQYQYELMNVHISITTAMSSQKIGANS
ncbi:type VI secretion system contractile sheath domain-containing protein [Parashewanella tropica]|uniref:type VI secretion system contractile sheath domain-containing protein n=1 Tax=Parashewanella tropica TaxID=2547970 RepID=UPI00105A0DE9|nr:type VI secretion system contractile sheath large subunit [Parashewanella tropica]